MPPEFELLTDSSALVMSKLLPCVFSAVPLAAFLKPAGDLLSNSNVEVKLSRYALFLFLTLLRLRKLY